jgi:hypothetical protein
VRDADALIDLGRLAEARGAIDEAVEIDRKTIGEAHTDHSEALLARAALLGAERRFAEAPPLVRRALALIEAEHGSESPALAQPLAALCDALLAASDGAAARESADRAVRLATVAPPDVRARAEFCWARAVWKEDRAAALARARAARARVAGLPFAEAEVARIDRWIAAPR